MGNGGKTKNWEKRLPTPHCHHSEDEGELSPQEEPELSLITGKLVNINTKLASHNAKLAELLPQPASPPDMGETTAHSWRSPTTPTT